MTRVATSSSVSPLCTPAACHTVLRRALPLDAFAAFSSFASSAAASAMSEAHDSCAAMELSSRDASIWLSIAESALVGRSGGPATSSARRATAPEGRS